ncbi:MAG: phage major capsid protein [Proteobacteria bacterium]|nr:phage major capsid protein [Pseudomonadota bacterium]
MHSWIASLRSQCRLTVGDLPHVEIFTDGACRGNPGPGGWAALIRSGAHEKEISGGEPLTTNNRMELAAAIEALRHQDAVAERVETIQEYDTSYSLPGVGRFRVNIHRQRGSLSLVLRIIAGHIPTIAELGLPPVLRKIAEEERALRLDTVDRSRLGAPPAEKDEERDEATSDERYAAAFDMFVRHGAADLTGEQRQVLRGGFVSGQELRAQGVGTPAAGGYLAPKAWRDRIIEAADTIANVAAEARVPTPYGKWFEVLEVLPFGLKPLRERLRAHDAGPLVVKKRGTAVEPDVLRRQLKLTGSREVTIVLTRAAGRQVAMVVRPTS